jgi:predicted RNA-binding protein YlxR (DUF448 family)
MPRVPERTCVGCRTRRPKAELVRVARRPDGVVTAHPAGTAPGRGAYVCRDRGCLELAGPRLARALRVALRPEDLATLSEEIEREIS